MSGKPIYVEIDIRAEMETLWRHTQTPELHEQWDLRFSEIDYLPRDGEEEPQRFRYRTRIGFGLAIAGTGETKANVELPGGERVSTLVFGSDQPISLIRKGAGYWKYTPGAGGVNFRTRYDYDTRFGIAGRLLDRLLFRPLFGYATAWSFDMLRIWLERGIRPTATLQRAAVHYAAVLALALLWMYQGAVPKLLHPEAGELLLLQRTGWLHGAGLRGWEEPLLGLLGLAEIAVGALIVLLHRRAAVYGLQAALLLLLPAVALIGSPELAAAPNNPLALSIAMLALGVAAALTATDLPRAGRCRRQPSSAAKGESPDGFHIRASAGR